MKALTLALAMTTSLLSLSAFAKTEYCTETGKATIETSANKIEITVKGIGEDDGALNFVDLNPRAFAAGEVEMYSELLKLPVASGMVTFANLVAGPNKAKAAIYEMTTEADLKGQAHKILMVSVADSLPSFLGMDTSCK